MAARAHAELVEQVVTDLALHELDRPARRARLRLIRGGQDFTCSRGRRPGVGVNRRHGFSGSEGGGVQPLNPSAVISGEQIAWFRHLHSGTSAQWWDDIYVGVDLGQGTAANRPVVTDPDAAFNGFATQNPDGVNDVLIATAGTEANVKPLHDGTGFLAAFPFSSVGTSADEMLWATCSSPIQIGIRVHWDSVAEALMVDISNGTTNVHSIKTANGTVPKNQKNRIVLWVKDGASGNEWEIWNNDVLIMFGTVTGAFSSSNPTSRLVAFRNPASGTLFHAGKWPELLLITNVNVVAQARAYLRTRYP